jgi:hypothetical protein
MEKKELLKEINQDLFNELGFKLRHKHKWIFVNNGKDRQGNYKKYKCNCNQSVSRYKIKQRWKN